MAQIKQIFDSAKSFFVRQRGGSRVALIIGALLVLCCLCSVPIAILSPKTTQPAASAPSTGPTQSIVDIANTQLAQAIATQTALAPKIIEPTSTPKPSQTPEPTLPPTPIPDPIIQEGSGDSIVDFDLSKFNGVGVARFEYIGTSNFIVEVLDSNNETVDIIVNTIGSYDGYVPVNFLDEENGSHFKIKSSGNWRVAIYPLAALKGTKYLSLNHPYQSTSDDVVFINDSPADVVFNYQGESNFIVKMFGENGIDLAVNEIGAYSGTVPIKGGMILMVVNASGPWSAQLK